VFTQAIALNIFLMLMYYIRGKLKQKINIMFRKIVSNLSFSPALVSQLGFYAKRLRKEETTRRLGLIFVVLALVVQGLTVFQPSESANASNAGDFVPGGLGLGANRSINNFLAPYDANSNHLRDVMTYLGVTRSEITSAQFSSFISGQKLSWGYAQRSGSTPVTITNSAGAAVTTVYARPLGIANGYNERIYGWIGHSAKIGWFAIMQACGNLVTDSIPPPPPAPPKKCVYNNAILATDENCKPCPGNSALWINDKLCIANVTQSKAAVNTSQGSVNASTISARESDAITFTVKVQNTGLNSKKVQLTDNVADVLEYSTLTDKGGGTLDASTKILSWPDVTLAPNETQVRSFAVRMLDTIPATAKGASDPTSFDCVMENVFGNTISIDVTCPTPKVVEQVVTQLPKTGPTENILFAGIVLAIVTYFYARTRQMKKEVRLIRRNLNVGTI